MTFNISQKAFSSLYFPAGVIKGVGGELAVNSVLTGSKLAKYFFTGC